MNVNDLEHEAARIRDSGILGTSGSLLRLFEFLVTASAAGVPKEIDIATTVFGKVETIDLALDATVRVYIHRLRRKLKDFYANSDGSMKLDIPRGSYRLVAVKSLAETGPLALQPEARIRRLGWSHWTLTLTAVAIINLLVWTIFWPRSSSPTIDAIRASAPWSAILANGRPTAIVVGDYYIFGEVDPPRGIDRMVRDYGVNSRADFDQLLMAHPALRPSYVDLDLTYLPAGTAHALRDLLPILARTDAERARTRVVLASSISPATLKIANIVYVGYFSGLGQLLRNPVFAGSRFTIGATWDELIDTKTGQSYHSDQGGPDQPGSGSRDVGYISTFAGTEGNRFVIIAGTRDAAVMQAADSASNIASLSEQRAHSGKADAYEAVYEVEGVDRVNMSGKLAMAAPLAVDRIWQNSDKAFPVR